jgi:hypothetical protein
LASDVIVFRKVEVAKSLVVSIVLSAILMFVGGCSPVEQVKTEPGDSQARSAAPFHDKCADTLGAFVNARGMVDYKRLRPKRDELGLFWINTYNLQKLKVVVDNYPITPSSRILAAYWGPLNLRHIEGKITAHRFPVMNEPFTFAEVEKRFFRSQFDDPRIFLALTSASLSSPPLREEPYYGHKLDEQLDDQVRMFLSSPLAFRIERDNRIVYLSAMFEVSSYGREFLDKFPTHKKFEDHPPTTRAALNFITNYISQKDTSFLELSNYSVKYVKHDWTINDGS